MTMEIEFKVTIGYSADDNVSMILDRDVMTNRLATAIEVVRQEGLISHSHSLSADWISVQLLDHKTTVEVPEPAKPRMTYHVGLDTFIADEVPKPAKPRMICHGTVGHWIICYQDIETGVYWLVDRQGHTPVHYQCLSTCHDVFKALIFDK